jgi:hypothetical protein
MTIYASTEPGLKARWLKLEECKAMKPVPEKHCRNCGAGPTPDSLCLECDAERLTLKGRFNKFPVPEHTVETLDEITPAKPTSTQPTIRRVSGEAPYRFPYKDPED